jgi:hypothetical protein
MEPTLKAGDRSEETGDLGTLRFGVVQNETLRAIFRHDVFATTHQTEDQPWSVS